MLGSDSILDERSSWQFGGWPGWTQTHCSNLGLGTCDIPQTDCGEIVTSV